LCGVVHSASTAAAPAAGGRWGGDSSAGDNYETRNDHDRQKDKQAAHIFLQETKAVGWGRRNDAAMSGKLRFASKFNVTIIAKKGIIFMVFGKFGRYGWKGRLPKKSREYPALFVLVALTDQFFTAKYQGREEN
jgi:hypothetical protein